MAASIDDYNLHPMDAQIALDISNTMADQLKHELAVLFAEQAQQYCTNPETMIKILERLSINAFYSKNPQKHELGAQACETLCVSRSTPEQSRSLAKLNSTYYAQSASDLMPSIKLREVNFVPPNNYKCNNPSITSYNSELWMIQRTVNYLLHNDRDYDMQGDGVVRTINYLLKLDHNLNVISSQQILPPSNLPDPLFNLVIGWEDCRLFFWQGQPWCTSSVRELNAQGYCEIVLSRIAANESNQLQFVDQQVIRPDFCDRQYEKNWMPCVVDDQLRFVYSSDPTRVVDQHGSLISSHTPLISAHSFRGGSQLVEFYNSWLALVHESHIMQDGRRRYMHRWVVYDKYYRLVQYSPAFYFKQVGVEFVAGLTKQPGTNNLIISWGFKDHSSWLAVVDMHDVKNILKSTGTIVRHPPFDPATVSWIDSHINTVLKHSHTVNQCCEITTAAGLPLHKDHPKNWDNLIAVCTAAVTTDLHAPVMDIAATTDSAFLPSLRKLGFTDLMSINLSQTETEVVDGVRYQYGDCTNTGLPSNHFGFVACLSVVEHGVNLDQFFEETARILKPGAHLLVSTDYWPSPIDTQNKIAFGVPVKIFDVNDIDAMIKIAQKYGLTTTTPVNTVSENRVVHWYGMSYTFINVLFVKTGQ